MKLKPADSYETPCKFCQFSTWVGHRQIGCEANKLEKAKYKEVYDETHEFFVVDGLCTFYRGPEWGGGEDPVGKAREECRIGFSLIFIVDDYNAQDLMNLKEFLKSVKYKENKIQVILAYSEKYKYTNEIKDTIKVVEEKGFSYYVVQYFSDIPEKIKYKEIFKRASNPFYITLTDKTLLKSKSLPLKKINKAINVNQERAVVFDDGYHKCLSVSAFMSNFENSYKDYLNIIEGEAKKQGLYLKI